MISGHGSSNPEVMLVADHAQGDDLTTRYALSGYKEQLIRSFCAKAKINFNDLYLTTLIKEDLPKMEGIKKSIFNNEAEYAKVFIDKVVPNYLPILQSEISTLRPNLIVPLGEISFQVLSGISSIRKFRGSVLRLNPLLGIERYTKILPILGPYPYLYTDPRQKFISQLDFSKIPRWSSHQPIPDDTFKIWVCESSTALRNYIERKHDECAKKKIEEGGYLVFDIESYMNIPTCISLCYDGFESCCIPFVDSSIDLDQRVMMAILVAKELASDLPKVNQNIKYDWKTQERWGFKINNVIGDTMLAASTLYCEFPKNLGFLTSIYTDLPYFKDEGRQFDPSRHKKSQFYLYNAKDSLADHQIYSKQLPELNELGVDRIYQKLIQLMPIYRKMEDRGIRIDEAARNKLTAKYQSLFDRHCLSLCRLINQENLNPLSPDQMDRIVFEELGYKKIRGVKGTDETSLNQLMAFGTPNNGTVGRGKEVLQEILWCRKIQKVLEICNLVIYPDGRFRCEFNLAGTETGRTSAGKTTDYWIQKERTKKGQKVKTINLGHSLQTIGKHGFYMEDELYGTDIRDMFVASPGFVFVEIDLSGAEARVDRVLSTNFDMDIFSNPGIHCLTGSWIFNCTPQDIIKGSLQYHLAKIVRHAGERRIGVNTLFLNIQDDGLGLTMSLDQCKKLLEKFHANESYIEKVFHRDVEACIKSTRNLICPNGRRRDFFGRPDHHTINEGISFIPQAVVSDQTKFSFIPTFDRCQWAHLLSEAHDGSLAEVPIDRKIDYFREYKKNIETPIDFRKGSLKRDYQLTIPCEAEAGESWGGLEKLCL